MKRGADVALVLARGALEVCVMLAWASLTLAMMSERRYTLGLALGAFAGGAALTRFCSGHRLRWRSPLQAAGAVLGALYTVHGLFAPTEPFSNFFWLNELIRLPPSAASWRVGAAFCAWSVVLWIAGCRFAARSDAYREVCGRFDRGLLWLFALLFVKLLLRQEPGVWQTQDRADALILPYFVFGLIAIAVARNRSDGRRSFMRGRRGAGLFVAFAALVLACGVGSTLFSLPFLHDASEVSYEQLAAFAGPFGPVIVEIVLFFLRGRMVLPLPDKRPIVRMSDSKPQPERQLDAVGLTAEAPTTFWLAACAVLCACIVLWLMYRWRSAPPGERGARWLQALWALVRAWLARWQVRWQRYLAQRRQDASLRIYRALLAWGRRSGLEARASETALEYGRRLQLQLGAAGPDIDRIVALYNARVYGDMLDAEAVRAGRRALRNLRSPRLWPQRVAAWLHG